MWLIKTVEELEDRRCPVIWLRAWNGHRQWYEQEKRTCNQDGKDDSPSELPQLWLAAANKRCDDKEQIDGHVGHDHPRDERDESFPRVIPSAYIGALRTEPVAPAVNNDEQQGKPGRSGGRCQFARFGHVGLIAGPPRQRHGENSPLIRFLL